MGGLILEMLAQLLLETLAVVPAWSRGCMWVLIAGLTLLAGLILMLVFG